MALVVEPGDGSLPSANTYASLQYVDDYHMLRRNLAWLEYSPAEREAAIIRAMDWVETQAYRGVKSAEAQPLEWPRDGVIGIPERVRQALAEVALLSIQGKLGDGPAAPVTSVVGGAVKSVSAGEISVTFDSGVTPVTQSVQAAVLAKPLALLRGLIFSSGADGLGGVSVVQVVRA